MKSRRSALTLAGFIVLNLAIGAIGGITTASSVNSWYGTLTKPAFNPPNFIFGPVWTTLYLLIAVAAWRIAISRHPQRPIALIVYGVQLLCNFLWSPLFFGLRNPTFALVDMALMLPAAVACQILFLRIDRTAGLMWVSYLAWISFALVLNAAIVWLN